MKEIKKIIRKCLNEIQFINKRDIDFDYLEDLIKNLNTFDVEKFGDRLKIIVNKDGDNIQITNDKIIYDLWPNSYENKLANETESDILKLIKKKLPEKPEIDINRELTDIGMERMNEIGKISYTAVVIENEKDIQKLKKVLNAVGGLPEGWKEPENYHMTVMLGELPLGLKMRGDLGAEAELEIISVGVSDLAIAVGITGYISKNETQHITLAF